MSNPPAPAAPAAAAAAAAPAAAAAAPAVPAAAAIPAAPAAPAAHEPLSYAYSTGNAFNSFAKFNGKNYITWRRNMETQLRALGQWEVIEGVATAPTPATANQPTPDEARAITAWNLRAARAYAEIALRLEDDHSEAIATTSDPVAAWTMLESSFGTQQAGIQSILDAELTLARWDGQTPINAHRDRMKNLRTRLAGAGLSLNAMQFYNRFLNSLPNEYDTLVATYNHAAANYSVDALCDSFKAIELRRELHATTEGSTPEESIALFTKLKGPKSVKRLDRERVGRTDSTGVKVRRPKGTCWACGKTGHYERDCRSKKHEHRAHGPRPAPTHPNKDSTHDKTGPSKPAGGTLLYAMEPEPLEAAQQSVEDHPMPEVAYRSTDDEGELYYIDSGATGHYIDNIYALHDYTPFEAPRIIRTAADHQVEALGSGTLKFTANVYGKETSGELSNVYYIPDIGSRLISIGKLFSQGWEPRLSRNGFALHNKEGKLVLRAPMRDNTYTVTMKTVYPPLALSAREDEATDDQLHERLNFPHVAFTTGGKEKPVSLYDWHRRMGHRDMKTIVDMAKGAVTGIRLKDLPKEVPRLNSCPSCALAKAKRTPFGPERTRAEEPLQLIHGDLVGPMPVESVSKKRYGFVLMDDYSRASWVLLLRAKSDAPIEFKKWVNLMENGTDKRVKTVMFDNAKELTAGGMKEMCDERGIHIITSVPFSPSSNGVAERLVGVATSATRAMLRDSGLPFRFWAEAMATFMYLRNRTPTSANEDNKTPYELFYNMVPDVSHIRTFGCVVRVTLPAETLGKLDARGAMGYLLGYKYDGAYRVWIPKKGVRESRDIVFYEDGAPILPDDGEVVEDNRVSLLPKATPILPPTTTTVAPTPPAAPPTPQNAANDPPSPATDPPAKRLTIRIPGKFHPRRAPQTRQASPQDEHEEPIQAPPPGDDPDAAPQYVRRIHQFPARSTRSGLVRNAGGGGALIAFGAFEEIEPAPVPTPTMTDPQTVHDALNAPDANEWAAAMDLEITNMRHLGVFREVPRPHDKNIITPKWVFRRKFEDGILIKHKARLVARGFTQVSGVDYHDAHLYAPVVRLESFRSLLSIAALFDFDVRQFDVSSAYLHGDIDGEVYMEPPPGYASADTVWILLKGLYGLKQAGRIWHEWLKADMNELGYTQCSRDHAVFSLGNWGSDDWTACAFWVDDEVGIGSRAQLDRVATMFDRKYGITGEGELRWILGMKVTRDYRTRTISLSQESYINSLVERFGLQHATSVTTPLAPGALLTKDRCPATPEEMREVANNNYRELVGSLQYAALATRPDISFAISKLAQFLINPGRAHIEAAHRVLRYVSGTRNRTLNLGGAIPDLAGFTDSDWGGDCDDRKSISAYVFCLGDAAVSWKTKKQNSVALSSVEAEYMAMCQAAKEAVWLTGLLEDLGIDLEAPPVVYGDNQGALALAQNPVFHPRSKHIDIQYHYTRELVQSQRITIKYIPTNVMLADALTKALPRPQHWALTRMIGVYVMELNPSHVDDEGECQD